MFFGKRPVPLVTLSEGSLPRVKEILRFAQNDRLNGYVF